MLIPATEYYKQSTIIEEGGTRWLATCKPSVGDCRSPGGKSPVSYKSQATRSAWPRRMLRRTGRGRRREAGFVSRMRCTLWRKFVRINSRVLNCM